MTYMYTCIFIYNKKSNSPTFLPFWLIPKLGSKLFILYIIWLSSYQKNCNLPNPINHFYSYSSWPCYGPAPTCHLKLFSFLDTQTNTSSQFSFFPSNWTLASAQSIFRILPNATNMSHHALYLKKNFWKKKTKQNSSIVQDPVQPLLFCKVLASFIQNECPLFCMSHILMLGLPRDST